MKTPSFSHTYSKSLLSKATKPDDANSCRGYLAFAGLLYQITLGLLWTYGNVLPYIASYITYHNAPHPVTKSSYDHYTSITNYSFFLLFTSLTCGAILGGKVEIYFGPSISMIISSIFVSVGFGSTCIALLMNQIYMVLFCYGVIFGLGIGLGYPILVIVCMRWFPDHQGRVCGIISAVFGGSPLIWDFVQEFFVNPHEYDMDDDVGYCLVKEVIDRIPYMFAYIAAIAVIMQIISLFCVRNPAWYIPEREQDDTIQTKTKEQLKYEKYSLTVSQSVGTGTFWIFWINNFVYSYVLMFIAAEWKEFANEHLNMQNDDYLSLMGSLGALSNGIGRFCWGVFYDFNRSFKISMGTQTFIVGFFIATLPFLKHITFLDINIIFGIWICCIWICVGCQYGFLPTCVSHTFGAKYTGSIVGLFIWCEAPASLLVVIITQYKDAVFGGWFYYTIFIGGCSFISTVLSIFTNENLNRKKIIKEQEKRQILKDEIADLSHLMSGHNGARTGIINRNVNMSLRSISEDSSLVWNGDDVSLGTESNTSLGINPVNGLQYQKCVWNSNKNNQNSHKNSI